MIYLYCFKKEYNIYRNYINDLINIIKINIKLNIIDIDIIDYINKNNLNYNINILITNISNSIIEKLDNTNIYLLNSKFITSKYLNNKNVKIITYNYFNKIYFKNALFLPMPFRIYNYKKLYDVAINGLDNEKKKYIFEKLKNNNIIVNDIYPYILNNNYNIIFKHKIYLNFNNNEENGLLNEYICNSCIYNNVIIVNDKDLMFKNTFLNNYIFDTNYDFIINMIDYILFNYNALCKKNYDKINYKINIKNNYNLIKNISNNTLNNINNNFGFIIIRHVNSDVVNNYWIESYQCIRKYYNNKIIIIDDNSNYDYIKYDFELINCTIINSEFKGSGEILPYYYLFKYHFFDKAFILHDSVFINKYIDFTSYKNVKFTWHFTHHWDNKPNELALLNKLKKKELNDFYDEKEKWYGCYGVQSFIEFNFLEKIANKYNIFCLLEYIKTRDLRMNFERIFGLICMYENKNMGEPSIFGIIHHYVHWGYLYSSYLEDKKTDKLKNYPIIKVWSGR